jgi:hypothetical protein
MPKEIIWSPLSLADMKGIVDYLSLNWPAGVINHFIDELIELSNNFHLILIHPLSFIQNSKYGNVSYLNTIPSITENTGKELRY